MSAQSQYYHREVTPDVGPVGPVAERPIVSSIRVDHGPGHDAVHVWNRGGKSGVLVVGLGDGEAVAELLLPVAQRGWEP